VSYNVHKVTYSIEHNINIQSITHSLATCFGSNEPSSGKFLICGHVSFSECAHYGIPYCLQTSFFLIPSLKSTD